MQTHLYDIAIIGGGIVGLSTAMALVTEHPISVIVLEAEDRLAAHQTGNNSGVIHSGLYYKPGSLKAKNCAEGREAMYQFCEAHDIPHERCGKVVVAIEERELPALDALYERGTANRLQGLKRLNGSELKEYEPHLVGIAGLLVPDTGIVDYTQIANTYAKLIAKAGGVIQVGAQVTGCHRLSNELRLETTQGEIRTRYLINCAGLYSDRIAKMCGVDTKIQIVPFRGEYYELTPEKEHLVNNLIYPVPDARFPFLGVHFTRMIQGGIEAGPNAVLAFKREGYQRSSFDPRDSWQTFSNPGFWRLAGKYWQTGFGEFYRSFSSQAFVQALQRLIPEVETTDVTRAGAGVRAQAMEPSGALVDDFRIVHAKRMTHVLNAPSPAATASLSIGQTIAALWAKDHEEGL
ncbi:L-2-hydroxyglutarate oxidase [Anaerolineales bacterium HSG25]|nr:L-2-hydroxyglutarate oxidase [Anaerolineales bacterium HSG25]